MGSEGFQVGSPGISGPGQEAFWTDYSPRYGSYLEPGESCAAQVYFGPHDAVEYDAQLTVGVGSYSFAADLSGTGGRATFSPASNPTDFGVAKVGAGVTREIRIANTGTGAAPDPKPDLAREAAPPSATVPAASGLHRGKPRRQRQRIQRRRGRASIRDARRALVAEVPAGLVVR